MNEMNAYLNPPGWHQSRPEPQWSWLDEVRWQIEELPRRGKELAQRTLRRKPRKKA